jgi:AcrR family transcriptional regulator
MYSYCMARPSRNVDAQLIRAGLELLPETGTAGLSLRKVAERAGANLGMFHYHFKTKDAFVRALLAALYEDMFADLELAAGDPAPLSALRKALGVLARFARTHRQLLRRLIGDAMNGEPLAQEFLRAHLPRHVGVVLGLVAAAQRAEIVKPMPPAQAVAFLAGAVAAPILMGSALVERGLAPPAVAAAFDDAVLSDAAIDSRIDLALAGMALPPVAPGPRRR